MRMVEAMASGVYCLICKMGKYPQIKIQLMSKDENDGFSAQICCLCFVKYGIGREIEDNIIIGGIKNDL